jgi:hypothetical protein
MLSGLALLLTLAVPAPAQERAKEQPKPTTRSLIEQLGARDYDERQQAEKKLLARGKAARAQLERAARDHEDPEVRWRARRVLRDLDRAGVGEQPDKSGQKGGLRRRQPGDRPQRRFDRPRERLERIEDVDRLFDEIFDRLERELDIDIKDVRRHIERARGEARAHVRDRDIQFDKQSKSMKMSVTPDGVRVEIEAKDRDGNVDKKVYEAEDMEDFKRKHPDVARRFGIGGEGIRIFGGGSGRRGDTGLDLRRWLDREGLNRRIQKQIEEHQKRQKELFERLRERQPRLFGEPRLRRLFDEEPFRVETRRQADAGDVPPRGERLGVYVGDLSPDVATFLGLDEGQGLQVEEVIAGSLAETLGIQKGDIVTKIGDRKIYSVDDVRTALRQIKAGETVSVQINRRGKVLGLGAKKPAGEQRKPASKKKPNKLKKRGQVR